MSQPAPIAVALDAPDLETAARWAALVTPHVSTVKIGLEPTCAMARKWWPRSAAPAASRSSWT